MLGKLFFTFTFVTLIEIGLLVQLGRWMGVMWTLILVFGTGFLGAVLVRDQGRLALERIKTDVDNARIPTDAVMDGVLIIVSGALLITPGVLTDLVGFGLLAPPIRLPIKRWSRNRFKTWIKEGKVRMAVHGPNIHADGYSPGEIIDVTVDPLDEDET